MGGNSYELAATKCDATGAAADCGGSVLPANPIHLDASKATGRSHSLVEQGKTPSSDASQEGPQTVTTGTRTGFTGVGVSATNSDTIAAVGVSAAIGGTAGVGVSGTVSVITVNTNATIGKHADVNDNAGAAAGPNVLVAAGNQFHQILAAASIAIGGSAGVGASVDVLVLHLNSNALIDDSATVRATNDITVTSIQTDTVDSITVAGGGGTVGVSAAVNVIVIANHVYASTGTNATIAAGNNAALLASDKTTFLGVTGGVAGGFVGVGAGVSVVLLGKDTEAFVGNGTSFTGNANGGDTIGGISNGTETDTSFGFGTVHGVAVQASSSEDVFGLVIAVGAGFVGVAVPVGVTLLTVKTEAFDGGSISSANGAVNISALDSFTSLTIAGGIGAGFVGVGAGVDIGIATTTTSAFVANGASVHAGTTVDVNALATKHVTTYSVAIGAGAVGVGGAVSVWSLGTGGATTYDDGQGDTGDGNTSADSGGASSEADSQVSGGGNGYQSILNGSSSGGSNSVETKTNSRISSHTGDANSSISASAPTGSPTQTALSTPIPGGTSATIDGTITAGGNVSVRALDSAGLFGIAGAIGAGAVGIGAGVLIGNVDTSTDAGILKDATVSSTSGTILVKANLHETTTAYAFAGAGGIVGVGGQIVVINDNSTQNAHIDTGAKIPLAGGGVNVEADTNRTVSTNAIGGEVGGVAVGVSVAVGNVGGSTTASVGGVQLGQTVGQNVASLRIHAGSTINATTQAIAVSAGAVALNGSVAIDNVTSTVGATLGDNAKVKVTGGVTIEAIAVTVVPVDVFAIAVSGLGGIGIAYGSAELQQTLTSSIGKNATVNAGGQVSVTASRTATATGIGAGVGAGLVGASAIFVFAHIKGSEVASIGDGTGITAGSVLVSATGIDTPQASVAQVGIGAVGAGGLAIEATDTSTLEAYIGPHFDQVASQASPTSVTTTGAGGVEIDATLTTVPLAQALMVNIGLLAAGGFTSAKATSTATALAYFGDGAVINAQGSAPVKVITNVTATSDAESLGIGVGLGFAAGGTTSTSKLDLTVGAYGVGHGSITGGAITFTTNLDKGFVPSSSNGPAYGQITLGSVALGAGIAAGVLTVEDSPTVTTGPGTGTTVTATGNVSITSTVFERANADGKSISGGLGAAAGVTVVKATAGGGTTTQVGGALTSTGTVTVSTTLDSATVATGRAIGVALGGAGNVASVTATTNPGANTTVGGSVGGHGLVQVTSTVTSDAKATADAFSVALGGTAAAVFITATNAPSVSATAGGASSSTGDVLIYAVNNYTGSVYPLGGSDSFNGNGAHASTSQVDVSLGLSIGATVATAEDDSSVAAGITGGSVSVPSGTLVIASRTPHLALPSVSLVSGGGASFSGLSSTLNIGGGSSAFIGNGSNVNASAVNVTAVGSNTETSTADSTGIAGVGGQFIDVELNDTSKVEAYIGPGFDGSDNPISGSSGNPTVVTTTGSGGISVSATGTSPAEIDSNFLGLGLIASLAFTKSVANVTPIIRSFLGDWAQVHANNGNAISFTTNAAVTTAVTSTGVGVSLGVAVGADVVTAHNNPEVGAFGVSNGTLTGGSATFTTNLNQGYGGSGPASATVTLGSVALGVGGAAATVTVTDSPTVRTGPGSGSANISGAITVTSNVLQHAFADGSSFSAGLGVGIGYADSTATAGGSTTTQFGAVASGNGTSLSVVSNVNASSHAVGRAVGISFVGSGAIVSTSATTNPTVSTSVAGAPHESGAFDVAAVVTSDALAESEAFSVALLGGSVSVNHTTATNAPNISASLAGGRSDSSDVVVRALNNYTGSVDPLPGTDSFSSNGAHAKTTTVSASLGFAVGATTTKAVDNSSVAAFITAGGTVSAPNGTIVVAARTPHEADPTQNSLVVGGVAFDGQDAESLTGGTVAAYVGDGATIANTARAEHLGREQQHDVGELVEPRHLRHRRNRHHGTRARHDDDRGLHRAEDRHLALGRALDDVRHGWLWRHHGERHRHVARLRDHGHALARAARLRRLHEHDGRGEGHRPGVPRRPGRSHARAAQSRSAPPGTSPPRRPAPGSPARSGSPRPPRARRRPSSRTSARSPSPAARSRPPR